MQLPGYGAPLLAHTFLLLRVVQSMCFIVIIGLTANFVSEIIATASPVPGDITGTLVVTSLVAFYTLVTVPFFLANAQLGLLIMAAADLLAVSGFVVISVVLGRPLSYLNCFHVSGESAASAWAYASASATSNSGGTLGLQAPANILAWAASARSSCFQTKTVWGFCIALSILFACSALILPSLWLKSRRAARGGPAAKLGA